MTENGLLHKLNPAVIKGATFTLAGLIVLAVPHASELVLRFILAGTFLVIGASDLWGSTPWPLMAPLTVMVSSTRCPSTCRGKSKC